MVRTDASHTHIGGPVVTCAGQNPIIYVGRYFLVWLLNEWFAYSQHLGLQDLRADAFERPQPVVRQALR